MEAELELSLAQIEVLSAPTRYEAFDAIQQLAEASAREVAAAIGRSPESVLYHLKALERAGLIRTAYRRPAPRKPESVFQPVAARFRLPAATSEAVERALHKAALAALAHAKRTLNDLDERSTPTGRISLMRATLSLSPTDRETFLDKLDEALEFAKSRKMADGLPVEWLSVVLPKL